MEADVPGPSGQRDAVEPLSKSSSSRMNLLVESFTKCLNYGLRAPALQEIQGYYPTLPAPVQQALLDLFKQVLAHISVHSQAEFADICTEYAMDAKLSEIERLCAQAASSQPTTDQGAADAAAATEAAAACARLTAKLSELEQLQALVAQAHSARDHLAGLVAQKRGEVARVADAYAAAANDIQTVYDAAGAGRGGVVGMEEEVTAC